ncbi:MAG: glycerol-3-phosphate dehydrogenase/oxidase [Actinomycetota bacterium]
MSLRSENLDRLDGGEFDVAIVGGGINGAVVAAALASRGVKVALVERSDFASATSQESSNLVWGGFKYLENYEIPLVFGLCGSRNRMMKAYPSRITEVRFLATLDKSSPFPPWLAALGSLAYWGIGRFATKPPSFLRPKRIKAMEPLVNVETARGGIEYADAYLKDNDSRFVWGFVRSALDLGGTAVNYVNLDQARRETDHWELDLTDTTSGRSLSMRAKVVVNAAGPFVDGLNASWGAATEHRIVFSKGIHLVVPRINASEKILAFFDDTQRLFYVIPMAHRSVIGTTDTRTDDPREPVTDEDREFLLEQINARLDLDQPLTTGDIISERNGVRPLVVTNDGDDRTDIDWTTLSRKHEVEVDEARSLVTIFGGKLTDCLNVGEEIADAVADLGITVGRAVDGWYGEPPRDEREAFMSAAAAGPLAAAPDIEREPSLAAVLWRRHGRDAFEVLAAVNEDPSLAEPVLAESDLLKAELPLYARNEMIVRFDDFLRRRTKLAMVHNADTLGASDGLAEARKMLDLAPEPA